MLLCDKDIRAELDTGRLVVDPWHPELLQPGSIDLTLDDQLLRFPPSAHPIDPAVKNVMLPLPIPPSGWLLPAGGMVLGATVERIELPDDLAARVEGKSGLGRLGLAAHVTAGFIDPGFRGTVTLELVNHAPRPFRLYPGMTIAQLCLVRMSGPAEFPYGSATVGSHYQGQARGPVPSRSYERWRTWSAGSSS